MIKNYINGEEFIKENEEFLKSFKYQNTFFFYDAPLLKEHTKTNYAFKVEENGKKLLVLKVVPYDVILIGDVKLVGEAIDNIFVNGYEFKNYLCEQELGLTIARILSERYNMIYEEALAMDYMTCSEKTHEYYNEVEVAKESDIDRIYDGLVNFVKECNLEDEIHKEKIINAIPHFRVIRDNGIISSLAIFVNYNDTESRISDVYTFPEFRGKGYCRKIVNNIKNEIIDSGKVATLNVDQRNPITNHIYSSIGFKRVFSQGEFRRKKESK